MNHRIKTAPLLFLGLAACWSMGGCTETTPPNSSVSSPTAETAHFRVLVIDDEPWAKHLEEQWKTRSISDTIEVKTISSEAFSTRERLACEIVICSPRWLGDLIDAQLLQPLPLEMLRDASVEVDNALPRLPADDWLPNVRESYISWGRTAYAVPLGAPQLMLLYRGDLFRKLNLSPPETWQEYQQLAAKLHDRSNLGDLAPAEDQPWCGALEPNGPHWAGTSLLARAAPYVRSEAQLYTLFDAESHRPRIAEKPYVRAAEEFQNAAKYGDETFQHTPASVREKFLAGHCGMAITWLEASGKVPSGFALELAPLPGSTETYSFQSGEWIENFKKQVARVSLTSFEGRIAAVTREARLSKSTFRILAWLNQDDTIRELLFRGESAAPFAETHCSSPEPWLPAGIAPATTKSYGNITRNILTNQRWMAAPRFPGQQEFSEQLHNSMHTMLRDASTPSVALKNVQASWTKILDTKDIDRWLRTYQSSAGAD